MNVNRRRLKRLFVKIERLKQWNRWVAVILILGVYLYLTMSLCDLKQDNYDNQPPDEEDRLILDTYPREGTGITVDIDKDFDPTVFNCFCNSVKELKAVLPVYSSVGNFENRYVLRGTLGKWAEKLNCKLFFIVGMSTEQGVNALLKEEYERERDILVVGKIDTYRGLNNKAAAMIEWIRRYCMNVPYVIHLIDDAYINIALFLERLDSLGTEESYLLGILADTPTDRAYWLHRSYVTVEEYPYPRFPIYAYGFANAFPSKIVPRLYEAMYTARYCWIEDVWLNGHVREKAGVKLIPLKDPEWTQSEKYTTNVTAMRKFFIVHGIKTVVLKKAYALEL